jgi:hypothetical protein
MAEYTMDGIWLSLSSSQHIFTCFLCHTLMRSCNSCQFVPLCQLGGSCSTTPRASGSATRRAILLAQSRARLMWTWAFCYVVVVVCEGLMAMCALGHGGSTCAVAEVWTSRSTLIFDRASPVCSPCFRSYIQISLFSRGRAVLPLSSA